MQSWGAMALTLVLALWATACSSGQDPQAESELQGEIAGSDAPAPTSSTTPTTAPTTTSTTLAPPTPIRWLAVGDSYSSGEGLDDATGPCSLSPTAYPGLTGVALEETDEIEIDRFLLAACTGAHSDDWPEQLALWEGEEPNLISATFGGNDVDFVGLMADCIGVDDSLDALDEAADLDLGAVAEQLLGRGCDRTEAEIEADIDGLQDPLEELYRSMAETVGDNGQVFIVGYPAPFADPDDWSQSRCDGVSREDGRLLVRAADRLNGTIEAATDVAPNVHFVAVAPGFTAHARCSADPWLYGLGDALDQVEDGDETRLVIRARPFHPNASGHEAMAELLTLAVSTTWINS